MGFGNLEVLIWGKRNLQRHLNIQHPFVFPSCSLADELQLVLQVIVG